MTTTASKMMTFSPFGTLQAPNLHGTLTAAGSLISKSHSFNSDAVESPPLTQL
jgi:hypothetical protein